jgi:hypothetical protein
MTSENFAAVKLKSSKCKMQAQTYIPFTVPAQHTVGTAGIGSGIDTIYSEHFSRFKRLIYKI